MVLSTTSPPNQPSLNAKLSNFVLILMKHCVEIKNGKLCSNPEFEGLGLLLLPPIRPSNQPATPARSSSPLLQPTTQARCYSSRNRNPYLQPITQTRFCSLSLQCAIPARRFSPPLKPAAPSCRSCTPLQPATLNNHCSLPLQPASQARKSNPLLQPLTPA